MFVPRRDGVRSPRLTRASRWQGLGGTPRGSLALRTGASLRGRRAPPREVGTGGAAPKAVVCGACLSVVRLFPRRPVSSYPSGVTGSGKSGSGKSAPPPPPTPPLAEKRHLGEPTRPSRADALGPSTEPGLRQARREGAAGAGGDASGLPGLLLARRQAGGHRAPSPLPSRPAGSGRSSSTLRGQSQSARGKSPAVVRALVSPLVPAQRWQQV